MSNDPAPKIDQNQTMDSDEELPRTVPLRRMTNIATQQAIDLPDGSEEVETHKLRASPHSGSVPRPAPRRKPVLPAPASKPMWKPQDRNPPTPVGTRTKLRVLRGQRVNAEFVLNEGANYMGRRGDEPIDIDLTDQEAGDRIWSSRRHAVIYLIAGALEIEDLHSRNGTFVNRNRLTPGSRRALHVNDVIQIGTIQLRVTS
jgi:hypothetical protein